MPLSQRKRTEAPGHLACLFPVCHSPRRPLSDHCPGHQLGARTCYPRSMTLVPRRLAQSDFSFSEPRASLSPLQLAPHRPHPAVLVNSRRVNCDSQGKSPGALCATTRRAHPRGCLVNSICSSLAPARGPGRNPEVSSGFRISQGSHGVPGEGEPGTPWRLGGGGNNQDSRSTGPR